MGLHAAHSEPGDKFLTLDIPHRASGTPIKSKPLSDINVSQASATYVDFVVPCESSFSDYVHRNTELDYGQASKTNAELNMESRHYKILKL